MRPPATVAGVAGFIDRHMVNYLSDNSQLREVLRWEPGTGLGADCVTPIRGSSLLRGEDEIAYGRVVDGLGAEQGSIRSGLERKSVMRVAIISTGYQSCSAIFAEGSREGGRAAHGDPVMRFVGSGDDQDGCFDHRTRHRVVRRGWSRSRGARPSRERA